MTTQTGFSENPLKSEPGSAEDAAHAAGRETISIPVITETAHMEILNEESGRVKVSKQVKAFEETYTSSLLDEEVHVNRVPVDRLVEGQMPEIRYENEVMIVPVLREEMVLTKKVRLVEEVHISRVTSRREDIQKIILSEEAIKIERTQT